MFPLKPQPPDGEPFFFWSLLLRQHFIFTRNPVLRPFPFTLDWVTWPPYPSWPWAHFHRRPLDFVSPFWRVPSVRQPFASGLRTEGSPTADLAIPVVPANWGGRPVCVLTAWMHSLPIPLSVAQTRLQVFLPAWGTQPNSYSGGRWPSVLHHWDDRGSAPHSALGLTSVLTFLFSVFRAPALLGPCSFSHLFFLLRCSEFFSFHGLHLSVLKSRSPKYLLLLYSSFHFYCLLNKSTIKWILAGGIHLSLIDSFAAQSLAPPFPN